jgi:hypothetical protein
MPLSDGKLQLDWPMTAADQGRMTPVRVDNATEEPSPDPKVDPPIRLSRALTAALSQNHDAPKGPTG